MAEDDRGSGDTVVPSLNTSDPKAEAELHGMHPTATVGAGTVAPGPSPAAEEAGAGSPGDDDGADAANSGLKREITTRQIMLMALSGSIGAGLFVGSGQGLSAGGPASLFLNFAVIGVMVCCVMAALGEMATSYPVAGAFYDYALRFVGRGWGFTMGWAFVVNWLIVLPFELTTIVAQLAFWTPETVGLKVGLVLGMLLLLALVAIMGAKWFGELEHWLGVCKAVAIVTFICMAMAIICRGIPGDPRGAVGARYWHDPGAFLNGGQGFLAVFRIAGMAYGGTELLGLTAAECKRPHRVLPLATKVVLFRIMALYGLPLLMLGFVVPANSPDLASAGHGAKYSPFVLAANLAGIQGLGHLFNAMILAALLSMANAAIFASSRALQALCKKGMGPAVFAGVNQKRGTPLNALYLAFAMGLLALVTLAPGGGALFDWLLSLAGVTNYFTWASICASHLRMRAAMRRQGRDPRADLIWRSPGAWGSWLAIAVCGAGLAAQVVTAAWPLHGRHDWQAGLRDCLGIIFVLAMFGGYMAVGVCRRNGRCEPVLVPLEEVDLDSGRRTRESASAADELAATEKRVARERLGYREDWSILKKVGFHVRREFRWLRIFRKRKAAREVQTEIPMT